MERFRTVSLVVLILLAALGAADGIYLTLVHLDYKTGHETVSAVCHAITQSGCSVTAGRYGSVLGIPIASIGFAGAATTAVLATAAFRRRSLSSDPLRSMLVVLAGISVFVSLLMAAASVVQSSFCPFCIAWYGINLLMLIAAVIAHGRETPVLATIDDAIGPAGFVAIAVFCSALTPIAWWYSSRLHFLKEQAAMELAKKAPAIARQYAAELRARGTTEIDIEELPSSGPLDAPLELIEFADFQCPHCEHLWSSIKAYRALHPDAVRARFVHYPLDSACNPSGGTMHPHACNASRAAICADQQGKFWEYADQLFANQTDLSKTALLHYASSVELDVDALETCMADPATDHRLQADIARGDAIELQSTPTLLVNGYKIEGALIPPIFNALMTELTHSHDGTPPAVEQQG